MNVVALSGGKDSTALALRLAEVEPELNPVYFCSPTGDELPEMDAHWRLLEQILDKPIVRVTNGTLDGWIDHFNALPSWRMRWCTRLLKIEPCLAWIKQQPERVTLLVGLRADEEERRGIYSNDVDCRFPMREWGWGIEEVRIYLTQQEITIPRRTDCARCYDQRLSEWWELWKTHPDTFQSAIDQEQRIGNTFRSPQRDSWPTSLVMLRAAFETGRMPRGATLQTEMFARAAGGCRVCRL